MFRSFRTPITLGFLATLLAAGVLSAGGTTPQEGAKKETDKTPTTVEALTAELERLRTEMAVLKAQLKEREEMIVKQATEILKQRDRAAAAEVAARAMQERAKKLLAQLGKVEIDASVKAGPKPGQAPGFEN